jgi:tetratricopeptide (TPR) repeat protein
MPDLGFFELCDHARAAVASGDLASGRRHFEAAIQIKNDSVEAHYGLATVCYLLKDYEAARHEFEEVRRLDPAHAGASINLGALCNLQGRYDEAVTHLTRGIRLDSKRSEAYYNLGIAYRRKGNNTLAIQAYREAFHLNPRMAEACYNLANIYHEMQRYDQAVEYYRKCIEIKPGFRKAYQGLQRAEEKLAESKAAEPNLDAEPILRHAPIKDPFENNPRLDRAIDPEMDLDTLAQCHSETSNATRLCEYWMITNNQLDAALRGLITGLAYDPASEEFREALRKFRGAVNDFRRTASQLDESVQALGEIRDKLATNA